MSSSRYTRSSAADAGPDPLFRAPDCSAQRITLSLTAGTHSLSFECVVAPARCAPLAHLFPVAAASAHARTRATRLVRASNSADFCVPDSLCLVGTRPRRLVIDTRTYLDLERPTH